MMRKEPHPSGKKLFESYWWSATNTLYWFLPEWNGNAPQPADPGPAHPDRWGQAAGVDWEGLKHSTNIIPLWFIYLFIWLHWTLKVNLLLQWGVMLEYYRNIKMNVRALQTPDISSMWNKTGTKMLHFCCWSKRTVLSTGVQKISQRHQWCYVGGTCAAR